MNKQIIILTVETAIETYLFNLSFQHGHILFTLFFGYLLLRRLYTTFIISRIAKAVDKATKK
ncbi:DUF3272 family protein [Streptococcus dentiloxodontae]